MIEVGRRQRLNVVKETDFGIYLGDETERVLLPKKQVPEGTQIGDELEVFVYRDSSDRLISTTRMPLIEMGSPARLAVKDVTTIGAFLDWGLEKDLLLPFKEQTRRVGPGETCLVALYVDKSGRLCATMDVYDYLETTDGYEKDEEVSGTVYDIRENLGAFVAVDDKYFGLIPHSEIYKDLKIGEVINARVMEVREDGKLNLSTRKKAYLQMEDDAQAIYEKISQEFGGVLPYNDKAAPEVIRKDFGMSKNEFKRAVGKLLKEGRISIEENSIGIREE
ncbi:CvfB family protein [Parasporobacterium paucivorans]|uniref:S1 motif domain-containing protein n=1 Tax=Parasporobacterium paucivorans DSM 15970 TaxID=1122934 RepID=A0A1M6KVT8_9FIRM|nr:hypothetical protein SAMN02745691_02279 [Parasporobacterium paucivorans DSM 15970]